MTWAKPASSGNPSGSIALDGVGDAKYLFEQVGVAGFGVCGNQILLAALEPLLRLGKKRGNNFFAIEIHILLNSPGPSDAIVGVKNHFAPVIATGLLGHDGYARVFH